ncbi:MAG: hypothetical protein ACRD3N_13200 [Terracidiphilus sp.]
MKRFIGFTFMALLTMGFLSAACHAQSVTFTLTDYTISVSPGSTATFDATVSAPGANLADVFLNADSFNIASPLSLDDTDFLSNFPLSLTPGQSYMGALFTVAVPSGTAHGVYDGSFTLVGGPNDLSTNDLGTVDFAVNVPEGSGFSMLLLSGALLIGLAVFTKEGGSARPSRNG